MGEVCISSHLDRLCRCNRLRQDGAESIALAFKKLGSLENLDLRRVRGGWLYPATSVSVVHLRLRRMEPLHDVSNASTLFFKDKCQNPDSLLIGLGASRVPWEERPPSGGLLGLVPGRLPVVKQGVAMWPCGPYRKGKCH